MVRTRLSDPCEPAQCCDGSDEVAEYLEAIALLEGEVARLEQELRLNASWPSETASHTVAEAGLGTEPAAAQREAAEALAEAEKLRAELARRDETIGLLMDHFHVVEETQAASRAEWEQLAGWVVELEQRVEGQDGAAAERLQEENHRLRAAWQELQERSDAGGAADRSSARLAEIMNERDALRGQIGRISDEMRRERLEHEAALAELQARLAHASLARSEEAKPATRSPADAPSPERDAELRVRALRQHLLEIHHREEEERSQKRLVARLSRLWSRTSPR
jgi:chromosome segregation ATPase